MQHKTRKSLLTFLLIYLSIVGFLFFFQRYLEYYPTGKIDHVAVGFEEKVLTTKDNLKILAWYKKPQSADKKIILYFHGNAGNLSDRSHVFSTFAENGFGVLAISYRGYAGSEGKPSEKGLMLDSKAALQFLLDQNYSAENIILFGESLGSGVATQLAAQFKPYAVILESPFSSIANVAQKQYPFVPVRLIMHDKFDSFKFAPKISSPVLIFHGTADSVVPYFEGQKLFTTITTQKKFITIEGGGHLNFGDQFLVDEMNKFFTEFK